MINLKKIICVLLGAALLMSTLAPAAFAEDGYAGMNTDKVLATEAFANSVFPAETLCVALSGEYVSAGESIGISICKVGTEGLLETVYTYGGDEMLIQYPCAENGNRLELYLRSESLLSYPPTYGYFLCIAEGSFVSAAGGNGRIEYELNNTQTSSMSLWFVYGESAPALTNYFAQGSALFAQGSVLSFHFDSLFFENRAITLTFSKEGVASASDDGSFTLSGVGWTTVTAKLNDFVYDEIEFESISDPMDAPRELERNNYRQNIIRAILHLLVFPLAGAIAAGFSSEPLLFIKACLSILWSIPLCLLNLVAAVFGVPFM